MKLDLWLATLRAASRPMDVATLHAGAKRIAARAQALTGMQTSFQVTTTPKGVRITALPPSPRAQRALDRAVDEQLATIRAEIGTQARERLTSG